MADSPYELRGIYFVLLCFAVFIVCQAQELQVEQQQHVDIAKFKVASQSSSYGPNNPPSAAIDDSPDTCSKTGEEKGASWSLDLEKMHVISQININTGNTFFGPNFELYIGDGVNKPGTLCGYGPPEISVTYNIQCFGGVMIGQTLTIQNRYSGGIKLCDVKLFECNDGFFGLKCDKQCHCEDDAVCSKSNGQCPGLCAPGYNGTDCQSDCVAGRFGAACRHVCHCANNDVCNVFTGECADGCAESWVGPNCQTAIPQLTHGPTLQAPRTTASEMTIMWPSWNNFVDPLILLYYQVEYKFCDYHNIASNESAIWRSGPLVNSTNSAMQYATVVGLRRNSFYEFRVVPFLHVNGEDKRGETSPHSAIFRTKCLVPEKPNITHLYSWSDDEAQTPRAVIYIEWTKLSQVQSNCDNIQYYEIEYQKQGSSDRQRVMAPHSATAKNITEGLEYESEYWLVVIAHNNQPLDSSSASVRIVTTARPAPILGRVEAPQKDAKSDFGIIIGVVVCASVVLVALLLIIVLYTRNRKYNSVPVKEPESKTFLNNMVRPGVRPDSSMGHLATSSNQTDPVPTKHFENGHANCKPNNDTIVPPVVHLPINVEDLDEYISSRRGCDCEELRKEYRELGEIINDASSSVGSRSENRLKNRFINILPYDHSRVILDKIEEDVDSDYINACYIDGYKKPKAYIAAQGCNKWTIQDMWRMVWQVNSSRIVMVTNLVEKGKLKCEQYWPDAENEEKMYGDLGVTLTSVERTVDFVVRSFELRHTDAIRHVKQFHYTSWPDHGVPVRSSPIIAFRRRIRSHDESHPGIIVIHCSAGVGRTGAFIALDYLLEQAEAERTIDLFGLTAKMRKDRSNMIQTVEQYIFVYDALLEALKVGKTVLSCSLFKQEFEMLCITDPAKGKSGLEEQYELLQELSPKSKPEDFNLGSQPENKEKNRFPDILPADRHRPYLMTRVQGTNDYINAVFLDGYRSSNAYIITQMPLPHTVIDVWRMIYEHKCGTIVMLNPWDDDDESMGQYWPEENEECECGPFIIEAMSIDRQVPDITVRELKLAFNPQSPVLKNPKKEDAPLTVNHFQFNGWNRESCRPASKVSLMTLLDMIERSQFKTGNHAVVIHCLDGVTQSGMFATISCVWERLKDEHEVDIFQAVKQLRFHRPEIIKDLDQYKFCHEMVLSYLEEFATYANFK